jgi:hypothetical protein
VRADERLARESVKTRSGGVCEGCGQRPATDYAHRTGKGVGGKWTAPNALHLDGPGNYGGCHGWAHQHPSLAKDAGWIVPSWRDPREVPAFIWADPWGPSWVLLDDAGYVHEGADLSALALGFPLVPDLPGRRNAA